MRIRPYFTLLASVSAVIFLFSSCSTPVGKFFGRQYEDALSYFNTFYNAERAYDDAMKDVDAAQTKTPLNDPLDTLYLAPSGKQKFVPVIEKCSKLLEAHPAGSYVGDALLMVGKSYYYQEDFMKAQRKFGELIATLPESDLVPEAKLWLGRTLFRDRRPGEAVAILQKLAEESSSSAPEIASEACGALGYIARAQDDLKGAAANYEKSLELSRDRQWRSRFAYQYALLEERQGNWPGAIAAYRAVLDGKPIFEIEFETRLRLASALARVGEYESSYKALDELSGNSLFKEQKPRVELERANVLLWQGKRVQATSEYTRIDTTYARTEVAALAYYQLGRIYEDSLRDYSRAALAYDKSAVQSPKAVTNIDAARRANLLRKYLSLQLQLLKMDSVIARQDTLHARAASGDSLAVDSLAILRGQSRLDSLGHDSTAVAGAKRDSSLAPHDSTRLSQAKPDSTLALTDSTHSTAVRASRFEASVWRRDSLTLRASAVDSLLERAPQDIDSLTKDAEVKNPVSTPDSSRAVMLPSTMGRRDSLPSAGAPHKRPELLPLDSLRTVRAKVEFELATLFYIDFAKSDSAERYFELALVDGPKADFSPQALFVLGGMKMDSVRSDTTARDSLYNRILDDFPASAYANEVRKARGLPLVALTKDSAEVEYRLGELFLQDSKPDSALNVFRKIPQSFPKSPYSAKAVFAIGWVYERTLNMPDSAVANYRRVTAEYPQSVYASAVKPWLAEIEAKEREKAAADTTRKRPTPPPIQSGGAPAVQTPSPVPGAMSPSATGATPQPIPPNDEIPRRPGRGRLPQTVPDTTKPAPRPDIE